MKPLSCAALLTTAAALAILSLSLAAPTSAQNTPAVAALPPPATLTNDADHQRLMGLLNMTTMRRGRNGSGSPQDPNFANYDESKATPFPDLPDPLTMKNGTKVTTAAQWPARRAEIVEDFDREIYGRVPKETPKVTWEITNTQNNGTSITRTLVGHVDNSSYPAITVNIQASVTVPANAPGLVPVIMQFSAGGGGFGGGRGPGAGRGAPGAAPGRGAPGAAPATPAAPATTPANRGGAFLTNDTDLVFVAAPGGGAGRGFGGGAAGPTWQQQCLAKGWGYGTINTGSIQADNGAGLTQGIIGLCNKGQPRGLEDWGVLRAWGWGVSQLIDGFRDHKEIGVDFMQVGVEGHSRWGKGTIVAMAYDPRVAIAYVSSSGEGGAHINRRNYGEVIENVAGGGEYHWMAGNFLKYAGPLTGKDLPVDGHELVALCAPRPVFISGGNANPDGTFAGKIAGVTDTEFTLVPTDGPTITYARHSAVQIQVDGQAVAAADIKPGMTASVTYRGNDSWQDPKGMYLAARDAGPVYTLLGKKDLGSADAAGMHLSSKEFPPIETPLLDGDVAFRQHTGGHTDAPNWTTFLTFADRYLKAPKPAAPN